MRFLIDTDVVAELLQPEPSQRVMDWLNAQPSLDVAISALTLGEIERGVTRLSSGRRRSQLERWISNDLPQQFQGRLLGVDDATVREWGRLAAQAETSGRALPVVEGLLLATAAVHGLTLVTRNESDCSGRGVPVLNPWRAGEPGL